MAYFQKYQQPVILIIVNMITAIRTVIVTMIFGMLIMAQLLRLHASLKQGNFQHSIRNLSDKIKAKPMPWL